MSLNTPLLGTDIDRTCRGLQEDAKVLISRIPAMSKGQLTFQLNRLNSQIATLKDYQCPSSAQESTKNRILSEVSATVTSALEQNNMIQYQTALTEDPFNLEVLKMRNAQLNKIEAQFEHIHNLNKTAAGLILEQGGQLDRIDLAMDTVVANTVKANEQVNKASENQVKKRKYLLICLAIVGVLVLVLLILTAAKFLL